MKLLLARFMLAFMLLWLPLQGYAAQSMHACQKHHAHEQLAESSPHEGCHGQHMSPHHEHTLAKANLACDDCSSCHLMAQPALIVTPLALVFDSVKLPQPISNVSFLPILPRTAATPASRVFLLIFSKSPQQAWQLSHPDYETRHARFPHPALSGGRGGRRLASRVSGLAGEWVVTPIARVMYDIQGTTS